MPTPKRKRMTASPTAAVVAAATAGEAVLVVRPAPGSPALGKALHAVGDQAAVEAVRADEADPDPGMRAGIGARAEVGAGADGARVGHVTGPTAGPRAGRGDPVGRAGEIEIVWNQMH